MWDMVHYDVQLIGGMVLHDGKISEMATGEGKTLVSTLPIFLNALAGQANRVEVMQGGGGRAKAAKSLTQTERRPDIMATVLGPW